jgi:hypothetical protein
MSRAPQFRQQPRMAPEAQCPRCGSPLWPTPWIERVALWPAEGFSSAPLVPNPEERYEATLVGDDVLEDRVYDALQADPRIPPQATIAVDVHDRVATLTGVVTDKWTKHTIAGDALAVPGIADVDNKITIRRRPRQPASTQ